MASANSLSLQNILGRAGLQQLAGPILILLILSMMEASVVDLPLPVVPVTSTRPRPRATILPMLSGGR